MASNRHSGFRRNDGYASKSSFQCCRNTRAWIMSLIYHTYLQNNTFESSLMVAPVALALIVMLLWFGSVRNLDPLSADEGGLTFECPALSIPVIPFPGSQKVSRYYRRCGPIRTGQIFQITARPEMPQLADSSSKKKSTGTYRGRVRDAGVSPSVVPWPSTPPP